MDLATLENNLKSAASQQGSKVTAMVNSYGTTYTVWNESRDKTGNMVITGKNDFTFTYGQHDNVVSGKVDGYNITTSKDAGTGKEKTATTLTGTATIDSTGTYTAVPQAQAVAVEKSQGTTDPLTPDPNNNVSSPQHAIEATNNSFTQIQGLLSLAPVIGLTDSITTNKSANPEEVKDKAESKDLGWLSAQGVMDFFAATSSYVTNQGRDTTNNVLASSSLASTENKTPDIAANKTDSAPGILESLFSFAGVGLTDSITTETNANPREVKDTAEDKSVTGASLLTASFEHLTSFYQGAKGVVADGVEEAAKEANTVIDTALGMKDTAQWATMR